MICYMVISLRSHGENELVVARVPARTGNVTDDNKGQTRRKIFCETLIWTEVVR